MNKIYLMPISYNKTMFESFYPLLSFNEQHYISKFHSFKNRYESLIARILFKKIIGAPEVAMTKNGQPYIPNSNIHISIAHCEGYVGIAFSEQAIGVDVELVQNLEYAQHFLHPEELLYAREHSLTLWTIKEAFVKWKTLGFSKIEPSTIQCKKETNAWKIVKQDCFVEVLHLENLQIAAVSSSNTKTETIILKECFL